MFNLATRSSETEIMDDLSRPEWEFTQAYRELAIINRYLGGVRAIERFVGRGLSVLDVAAGGCDVSDAIAELVTGRVVALDWNERGLKFARRSLPVVGDAFELPFPDNAFDVVMSSLFFHHLSDEDCVRALKEMWRIARRLVLVNDLHRHRVAHTSIRVLTSLFSRSTMARHDGPVSVRRAFRPDELLKISRDAGVPARVYRSFPYRLVLVGEK